MRDVRLIDREPIPGVFWENFCSTFRRLAQYRVGVVEKILLHIAAYIQSGRVHKIGTYPTGWDNPNLPFRDSDLSISEGCDLGNWQDLLHVAISRILRVAKYVPAFYLYDGIRIIESLDVFRYRQLSDRSNDACMSHRAAAWIPDVNAEDRRIIISPMESPMRFWLPSRSHIGFGCTTDSWRKTRCWARARGSKWGRYVRTRGYWCRIDCYLRYFDVFWIHWYMYLLL